MAEEEVTEANLVRRILRALEIGPTNPYFYEKLPKAFKERFSYKDVLTLFSELEWDVKVIEIDRIRETSAYNPWKGNITVSKKVIEYYL